jgi:hypothetical protein
VSVLAALAVVLQIAHAEPEEPPAPADADRQSERYVLPASAEPLLSDMLGNEQALPGGCTFSNGSIERTFVLATYACGDGQVVLQLLHPEVAPRGGVRTQRFALTVKSGTPPAGFVEAIGDRIRAREAAFEWTVAPAYAAGKRGGSGTRTGLLAISLAAGIATAVFVVWALRRLLVRRRSAD